MNVAIIPARGGSKRIPGKNIRDFAGKPLISYSIEATRKSGIFDHVFVSTDSPDIARVASEYGAEIPFIRGSDIADDFTGTDAVVFDTLQRITKLGIHADYVCCVYATAPFIRPADLKKGFDILCSCEECSAFTVTTFPAPIFRALKMNEHDTLEMVWAKHRMTRSQDLPECFHDAGQFYWATVKHFLAEKSFWSCNTIPIVLPRYRVQDIDTFEDWEVAERMYKALQGDG